MLRERFKNNHMKVISMWELAARAWEDADRYFMLGFNAKDPEAKADGMELYRQAYTDFLCWVDAIVCRYYEEQAGLWQ